MSYFRNHGTVYYKLPTGETVIINDLSVFVGLSQKYKDNPSLYLNYTLKDGDRFDTLSNRLYKTVDYWWTIPLFNGLFDFDNQLPLSEDELSTQIAIKYPFKQVADIHHYETLDGFITDLFSVKEKYKLNLESDAVARLNLKPVSILEYETNLNQAKRNIKMIDPDYIRRFVDEVQSFYKAKV